MRLRLLSAGFFAAVAVACPAPAPPPCVAAAPLDAWEATSLRPEAFVALRTGEGVRVRGFAGAAPAGALLRLGVGGQTLDVRADDVGAFDVLLDGGDAARAEIALVTPAGEEAVTLRVRDEKDALACVVGPPEPTGTTPNDLELVRCEERLLALVAVSAEGSVDAVSFDGDDAPASAVFAVDAASRPPNPYHLAVSPDGARAATSLFGQHAAALLDPCAGKVLDVERPRRKDGELLLLELHAPLEVETAVDADEDGATETRVFRMALRHPQGVALVGDRLLVSYTNLVQLLPTPVAGPGAVVAFDVEGKTLQTAAVSLLPFQNPQGLTLDDQGRPWVSCSGVLGRDAEGRFRALTDGGLVRLDPETLEVEEVIELGRFAPGTPAFGPRHVVVGSLVTPEAVVLPTGARALDDGAVLPLGEDRTESLFETAAYAGSIFLVTEFGTDRLRVIDADALAVDPWPFSEGLPIGPGGAAFRGAQALSLAPARPEGDAPDGAVLLSRSSEVVPLRLWQVIGP